ncbi:DUF6904 family protein [Planococcus sp. YIM B11945]|uniref:DUF6904 family protein n=1 Tax=Planococcus sp. YIM B11945 TaxID=3435410 RepID=UPI003D7E67F0
MLTITNTPLHTGVKISGDYFDLDELNQAIYHVVGDEEKYYDFAGPRMRILGVSYEIRHAAQGDRNIEQVFNGLHEHAKKQHRFIAPDKNIYFSVEILWPEILFTAIALKDFVRLYRKDAKNAEWDIYLPVISRFQALILDCLHGQVEEQVYQTVVQAYTQAVLGEEYAVQYIDFLNLKYLGLSKSEREKMLPAFAGKIAVQDADYQTFRQQVLAAANPSKMALHEIRLQADYPEKIEW